MTKTLVPGVPVSLFLLRRDVVRRQGSAFTEEILLHLLEQKLLRLGGSEIQPILVHEHLHVLDPHLPGVFRNVVVDALAQWMTFERYLIEAHHIALKFDAENLVRSLGNRFKLVEIDAGATAHTLRIPARKGPIRLRFAGDY